MHDSDSILYISSHTPDIKTGVNINPGMDLTSLTVFLPFLISYTMDWSHMLTNVTDS